MWLLNCETLKCERVLQYERYAILSHTWGSEAEEITFRDLDNVQVAQSKKGWDKLENSCNVAKAAGYKYIWNDTCCINKESSSELSEAINSMFEWYASADVCYAYLEDFDSRDEAQSFASSRWFTRGWTLQELIAPSDVQFFDTNWVNFGNRGDLKEQLSSITNIQQNVLKSSTGRNIRALLEEVPVARRMAWAALRATTRIEDRAYSLLGIFNCFMPLIYGEGWRAFQRLQETIINKTDDLSLLAWRSEATTIKSGPSKGETISLRQCGILASSPRQFSRSHDIQQLKARGQQPQITMTNRGIRITKHFIEHGRNLLFLGLMCCSGGDERQELKILLEPLDEHTYGRKSPDKLFRNPAGKSQWRDICICLSTNMHYISQHASPTNLGPNIYIAKGLRMLSRGGGVRAGPRRGSWDESTHTFLTHGLSAFSGFYIFRESYSQLPIAISFGFDTEKSFWLLITTLNVQPDIYKAICSESEDRLMGLKNTATTETPSLSINLTRNLTKTITISTEKYFSDGIPVYVIDAVGQVTRVQTRSEGRCCVIL